MWHRGDEIIESPIPIVADNGDHLPAAIFIRWSEEELNEVGIYTLTETKPELPDDTKKHADHVDDLTAHTRTYEIIDKTAEEIKAEADEASRQVLDDLKKAANKAELAILIENGTTPEAIAYRTARDS